MITLCLQSGSRRIPLQLDATDTTVKDLYELAVKELATTDDGLQLRSGVPPRLLDCEKDGTKTLVDCGIRHQDRVVVAPLVVSKRTKPDDSPQRRTTKRKAAQAATAAFPEVIAQQEAALQNIKSTKATKKKKKAQSASSPKKTTSASRHFAALQRDTSGVAFRLSDGQPVVKKSPRKRAIQPQALGEGGAASLEEAMVSSTSGLRGGWRDAVASAYAHNQAAARVAALTADCVFQVDGETLTVTYPKGIQGRGTFEDVVPLLPSDALAAAVRSVKLKEGFRHMALLSPRVYWSLRYHHASTECRTVQECLEAVAPDINWRFLRHRQRALSSKARENLRQEQEMEQDHDWEAAAHAIAQVEDAMADVASVATGSSGVAPATTTADWRIVTPDEEDLEELKECIQQCLADNQNVEDLAQLLLEKGIHNWRQLANHPGDDSIPEQWIEYAQTQSLEEIMVEICDGDCDAVAVLRDDAHTGTPRDLTLWRRVATTLQEQVPAYSVSQLQRWCDRAAAAMEQLPWLGDFQTPI